MRKCEGEWKKGTQIDQFSASIKVFAQTWNPWMMFICQASLNALGKLASSQEVPIVANFGDESLCIRIQGIFWADLSSLVSCIWFVSSRVWNNAPVFTELYYVSDDKNPVTTG